MPRQSSASSDAPFLYYFDKLLEELHKSTIKALNDFDAEAIHDARVATRRLKAALDLAEPVLSDEHSKPLSKALKKLRRTLGPLRDLDVTVGHLDELSANARHGAAAAWLRNCLIQRREQKRDKARKNDGANSMLARLEAWGHVRDELVEAHDAIDSLLASSLHLQLDAFSERVVGIVSDSGPSQDPHEVRIAAKRLRYTLELAAAQGHKLPSAILRSFKKMQESLGNWHDWVVLIERAMKTSLDESLPYHDSRMQEQLLDLCRYLLRRCSRELEHFAKRWRERGEDVTRAIRQTFPLTQPIIVPQTDRDPGGSGGTPAPAAPPPDAVSTA